VNEPEQITLDVARQWLSELGANYYICDNCAGLHLTSIGDENDGRECRLFVEEWGLLFSTEFAIKPSMLLPIVASLGQLNGSYPTLKLFVDIADDTMPQLIAGATQLTGAGINQAQFELFVSSSVEMSQGVLADLSDMACLLDEDGEDPAGAHQSLH
jgi:hypothetical protein